MGFWEVVLTAFALAMDACAVGMTNGMTDRKMPVRRALFIGFTFGVFQFFMPVVGYFVTHLIEGAFQDAFEKISSWVAFALLAFLGGKMIFDAVKEGIAQKRERENPVGCEGCDTVGCAVKEEKDDFSCGKLFLQAIATSIDALAVGISMKMATMISGELAFGIFGSVGAIGIITLALSFLAVYVGKAIGNKLADKAELVGGIVLVLIGVKLLLEGIL